MTTEDRIEKLERSCRHHRRINIGLAILVLLIVSFGAARVEGRYSSLVLNDAGSLRIDHETGKMHSVVWREAKSRPVTILRKQLDQAIDPAPPAPVREGYIGA